MVDIPSVSPEPPIMMVINNVPSTIPPMNLGMCWVTNIGKACAELAITPIFSGISFPIIANELASSAVM